MSVFDKVRDAKPTGGGTYFESDHEFLVRVNAVKHVDVRKGKEGAFIVECTVLETTCEKCRVGAERSWYVDLDKDAAANNLKGFGMAVGEVLTGEEMDEGDVDGAALLAMTKADQPVAGQIMWTKTWNKPTGKGTPFTRHKWWAPTKEESARGEKVVTKLDGADEEPKKRAAR